MSVEAWMFQQVSDAVQGITGVSVFTGRQDVSQTGDVDTINLPSVLIKRDGVAQSFPLDEDEDDSVDEAAFTMYLMSEDYEQVVDMERRILKTLKGSNRLTSAVIGDDQLTGFRFYTRMTEVRVRAD